MNFIYRYHQPIHTGVTISTELIPQIYGNHFSLDVKYCILGDPGATSWDDAIFSGESLLQELKSHWELILNEPVPEVVEFCPADWAEKYFSAQSAMRSSRVTLSPFYTKQFFSSINLIAWPVQREDCVRKKYSTKPRKSQALTWGLRTNTLHIFSQWIYRKYILSFCSLCTRFLHCCFWSQERLVEYPRLLIISPRTSNNF